MDVDRALERARADEARAHQEAELAARERTQAFHGVGHQGAADAADALALAVARGDAGGVAAALERGAPPEAVLGRAGERALAVAVRCGDVAVAEALIGAGANVNAVGAGGESLLHVAALGRSPEMVYLLCAHGASVHARDRMGRTPRELRAAHSMVPPAVDAVDVALGREEARAHAPLAGRASPAQESSRAR